MAMLKAALWVTATLCAIAGQQSFVSAQGLNRLANGFIVEFVDVPDESSRVRPKTSPRLRFPISQERQIADISVQSTVIQDVASQVAQATSGVIQVAHKLDLRSSLFSGASFRVTGSNFGAASSAQFQRRASQGATVDDVVEATLMQMPNIAAVYLNRIHYMQAATEMSNNVLSAENEEQFLVRRQDGSSGANTSVIFPAEGTPLINPHMLTGVDKLHAQGMGGQGIRIAIIDAGIDPSHPALGAGYGPGFKVEGGFDFVGEEPVTPDNSPITTCSNHGTATSSIAAGLPCESAVPSEKNQMGEDGEKKRWPRRMLNDQWHTESADVLHR